MALSITRIIKNYLKDNRLTQVYLAESLQESPQNLANKLRKNALDTDYVRRICIALDHDFFYDLSLQLKPELKGGTKGPENSGVVVLGIGDGAYVRPEQYIRLLEENLELYRELLKAGRE